MVIRRFCALVFRLLFSKVKAVKFHGQLDLCHIGIKNLKIFLHKYAAGTGRSYSVWRGG